MKPGSLMTEPKALIPANRSAANSGIRKYTPATRRITQRQTGQDLRLSGSSRAGYRSHLAALRCNTT